MALVGLTLKDPIPFSLPHLPAGTEAAVLAVLRSGWLSRGAKCEELEEKVAASVGARHAVSLSSCTAALHCALLAHGVGPGDAVIVPAMTFVATANSVLMTGATPVFVDCLSDYTFDPREISPILDRRPEVKAVLGVDMHGKPCHRPARHSFILPPGVVFLRDAAHSLGALTASGPVGGRETTCFSFYTTKNIGCGEGGMLTTDDPSVAERVRKLSQHGMAADAWKRYAPGTRVDPHISELGYNYKLTDLQAAIALGQLEYLGQSIIDRRYLAGKYHSALSDLADAGRIELPIWKGCWHLYAIRIAGQISRDEVQERLRERGIATGVHFRPIHRLPHLQSYADPSGYPMAEQLGRETLSLPFYPDLSLRQVQRVADALKEILGD